MVCEPEAALGTWKNCIASWRDLGFISSEHFRLMGQHDWTAKFCKPLQSEVFIQEWLDTFHSLAVTFDRPFPMGTWFTAKFYSNGEFTSKGIVLMVDVGCSHVQRSDYV